MSGLQLSGRVALVTGAAGGLGAGIASRLAQDGARVAVCDIRPEAGEEMARGIGSGAAFFQLDIGAVSEWQAAAIAILERFGRVDILVNNAGINDRKGIADTTLAEWERTLRINLTGAFYGMQTIAPHMRGRGGAIVNVSSTSGLGGHPDAPYSAAKWGLRGLSKTAALEFADWNIRVNAILPGSVPTGLHSNAPPGHAAVWRKLIPMRRPGRVEEIAEAVMFLASDRSSFMTGAELVADGGLMSCGLSAGHSRLLDEHARDDGDH